MSIVILQTFKAQAGKYEALAAAIAGMLPATAAKKGATFVHAAGDAANGVITVYQQWDSAEDQAAYQAWRMQQPGLAEMFALIDGAPKIEQLAKVF